MARRTGCMGSAGARNALEAGLGERYKVTRTSCLGLCDRAPAALVGLTQAGPVDPDQPDAVLDLSARLFWKSGCATIRLRLCAGSGVVDEFKVWVDLNKCILCTCCEGTCAEIQGRLVCAVGEREAI